MATTQLVLSKLGEIWLDVKANGGSVAVERQVGSDWIVADKFSMDGSFRLDPGMAKTRFTPAGGAAFQITDISGNKKETSE